MYFLFQMYFKIYFKLCKMHSPPPFQMHLIFTQIHSYSISLKFHIHHSLKFTFTRRGEDERRRALARNRLGSALTHSLTYSLTHSLTHSRIHSLINSFTHSLIHSFTHWFTHSFIFHSLVHPLIFTHSLTH